MPATARTTRSNARLPAVSPGYIKSTEEFREHEIFLIREVHHRLHTKIESELRKRHDKDKNKDRGAGLSFPMARVLHVVSVEPGLSNAQLARRANVTAQSMNGLVLALEKAGYIERTADPENARVLKCYALPAGVALMQKSVSNVCDAFDSAVSALSARDRAELRRLLRLLIEKVHVDSAAPDLLDEMARKARTHKRKGSR
jgi:DNA-binding MarR family transcriptional regulator